MAESKSGMDVCSTKTPRGVPRDENQVLGLPWTDVLLASVHGPFFASVAQLAERLTCNQLVGGSSPPAGPRGDCVWIN